IQRVDGEIDLRLGPRCPHLGHGRAAAGAAFRFIWACFARHRRLLDFAVESMTAQSRIVLHQLQFFSLKLLIPGGGIARRRLTFLARLGALDGDDFARHNGYSFSLGFSSASSASSSVSLTPTASTVPSAPKRRWRKAPSRSSWACA